MSRGPEDAKELTVARNIRKAAVGISAGGGGNGENLPGRGTNSWEEDVGAATGEAEDVLCPEALPRDLGIGSAGREEVVGCFSGMALRAAGREAPLAAGCRRGLASSVSSPGTRRGLSGRATSPEVVVTGTAISSITGGASEVATLAGATPEAVDSFPRAEGRRGVCTPTYVHGRFQGPSGLADGDVAYDTDFLQ